MRKTAVLFMAVCGALLGAGCETELGACDAEAARTLVYDNQGNPSFAGQALVNGTCSGAFCHGSGATTEQRHGVPAGFDFDVAFVTIDDDVQSLEKLRANRLRIVDSAGDFWSSIEDGDMPRPNEVLDFHANFAEQEWAFARAARGDERMLVPRLDTPEGKQLVRNWIACGAPVVDRLEGVTFPAGVAAVGDPAARDPFGVCIVDADCPAGDKCYVGVDPDADPTTGICGPLPEWPALFTRVIAGTCAVEGCHGGVPPGRSEPSGLLLLDPDDSDVSYDDLVAVASMGAVCIDAPRTRVIANDAMDSLLIKKLEGDGSPDGAECGDRMPQGGPYLSPATIAAFREWIDTGALRTPPPP